MIMKNFIEEIETFKDKLSIEAQEFLEELKLKSLETPEFTEKGLKILMCMQDNKDKYMNVFSSKILGELLFASPRSISGAMKKIIAQGYVEKVGQNPVSYGLTPKGMEYKVDKE